MLIEDMPLLVGQFVAETKSVELIV